MKCISNIQKKMLPGILLVSVCLFSGCGQMPYTMPYDANADRSSFNVISGQTGNRAQPFAADLCVVTGDVTENTDVNMEAAAADNNRVVYAKNAHEIRNPASLTKVMTALVALKYGSLDQTLTATDAVTITEAGAVLGGLKPGDTMTMDQALRILLLYSANDVGLLIAENVGGSVEQFVAMMNEEAHRLGATQTNFTNPHGLTDTNHYTTAYDLYLIFNEAIKYDAFTEIIQMTSYQTTYYDSSGKPKEFNKQTSNLFLRGDYKAPANVTVIGGKTGTTNAAGRCLILLTRDVNGAPYVSIVMGSESPDSLYREMIDLLDEIQK